MHKPADARMPAGMPLKDNKKLSVKGEVGGGVADERGRGHRKGVSSCNRCDADKPGDLDHAHDLDHKAFRRGIYVWRDVGSNPHLGHRTKHPKGHNATALRVHITHFH